MPAGCERSGFVKMDRTIKMICAALLACTAAFCAPVCAAGEPELTARTVLSGASAENMSGAALYDERSGVQKPAYVPSGTQLSASAELPASYVTPTTGIRTQGSVNTCWAFSGLGALEAFLSHDGKGDRDLSEQHLSWWATKTYNTDGLGWLTPNLDYGGYSMISAGYLTSWEGPKSEEKIPYPVSGNTVIPSNMDDAETLYGVTGIMYVAEDTESVKTAIMRYGGVATSFNNGSGYNEGRSAYYQSYDPSYYSGHAITIVGWDDNYSRENFREDDRPDHDGAWLAKNSWGSAKGDNGYLWISYYDRCVLETDIWGANLAITGARTLKGYERIYQNETYGATFYTYLSGKRGMLAEATFVNVFNFDEQHKYLQEVVFETQALGAEYRVYYIPLKNGRPTADRGEWVFLTSGQVDHSGYICADVSGQLEVGGKGAIGVTIDDSQSSYPMAQLGVDEWLVNSSGDMIFKPKTRRNASYVIDGSNVYDLLDIYDDNGDSVGGMLVIKAIACSNVIGDVNDDASVSSADALTVLRETVGMSSGLTQKQFDNGDVNFDGYLTSEDSLMILRKSLGILAEF